MKTLLCLVILLVASNGYCLSGTDIGVTGFNPSLPVFGDGPFLNLQQDGDARLNAAMHVAWALAIPLIGERLWGSKGKWITGLSWIALTLIQESLFHAPKDGGPNYPSEVRTDLITRIVPTLVVLTW